MENLISGMMGLLFTFLFVNNINIAQTRQVQSSLFDQHPPVRCSVDKRMEKIYLKNPGYRQKIQRARFKVRNQSNQTKIRTSEEILTIPVHVIIVHPNNQSIGQGDNIPESRIQDQINRLNADFRKTNSDADMTPVAFPTADSKIEFCLAKIDPSNNASSGISRYAFNGNFDNNETQIKTTTGWDPKKYLNIWVASTIDGLGYAYLPSPESLPEAEIDGVVVLTSTFGDGPELEGPYDKGRTATHEVGHYLGLDHIWGNGCNADDGISDTPPQQTENYGCVSHPSPSCSNQGDMFMNYMDYSDDACMFAFTPGQSNYMRQILETSRNNLVTRGAQICGGSNNDCTNSPPVSGVINTGEYLISGSITTGGNLATQSNVTLQSPVSIDLTEGFSVPLGSMLKVNIDDCASSKNHLNMLRKTKNE